MWYIWSWSSKSSRRNICKALTPRHAESSIALEQLSRLEGNIVPLAGYTSRYRYKIDHYRIVFDWIRGQIVITVIEINTRTNIKY